MAGKQKKKPKSDEEDEMLILVCQIEEIETVTGVRIPRDADGFAGISGKRAKVVEELSGEEGILLCQPAVLHSPFQGNVKGKCAACGRAIVARPYMPEHLTRVCPWCARDVYEVPIADELIEYYEKQMRFAN